MSNRQQPKSPMAEGKAYISQHVGNRSG